jgi:hypothetical protein
VIPKERLDLMRRYTGDDTVLDLLDEIDRMNLALALLFEELMEARMVMLKNGKEE